DPYIFWHPLTNSPMIVQLLKGLGRKHDSFIFTMLRRSCKSDFPRPEASIRSGRISFHVGSNTVRPSIIPRLEPRQYANDIRPYCYVTRGKLLRKCPAPRTVLACH